MAKVSIIVPIYGVEKYLKKAIDSLISQTLADIEIILINDGSKDNCKTIIDEYASRDARIIAIHKENSGYGATVNLGLEKAKGEYVAILEPDDYVESNMYEDLYKIAKEYNSDIVKSSFYDNLQSEHKKCVKKANWDYNKIPQNKSFTINECPLFLYYHPSIWSCIYKKEFIEKHNIRFNEVAGAGWSDNPFQVQTMCLAERINFTPNAYYYWLRKNENESVDLKDIAIPFERSKEIHNWLNENNIKNEQLLLQLYKRELNYINIILDKNMDISQYLNNIEEILNSYPEEKFLKSPFAQKTHKKLIKTLKNLISNSKQEKTLNICFASNENYVQHLCCALKSIFANKKRNENFNIIILNENISLKSQKYIEKLLPKGSRVEFINVDKGAFKYCPLTEDAFHIKSLSTYFRFVLPSVCNFDKVLYLDCDIIVKKSLSELFETNIENYYIAGVEDCYVDENCKRLGLDKYVNAGVLLINLKKWREDNIQEKLFTWAKENQEKILWVDQDVINSVLNEKIFYLNEEFNAQISELEFGKTKEYNRIAERATIVHYVGHRKPWSHFGFKLNKYYYDYLKLLNGNLVWKIIFCLYCFKHYRKQIIKLKISKNRTYIVLFGKTLYEKNLEIE